MKKHNGNGNSKTWDYVVLLEGQASHDVPAVRRLTNRINSQLKDLGTATEIRNTKGAYEIYVTLSTLAPKSIIEHATGNYGLVKSKELKKPEVFSKKELEQRTLLQQNAQEHTKEKEKLQEENQILTQNNNTLEQEKKELEELLEDFDASQSKINFNQAAKYIEDYVTEIVARIENLQNYISPFEKKYKDEIKKNKDNKELVEFYETFGNELPAMMQQSAKEKYERAKKDIPKFEETKTMYEAIHTEAVAHLKRLEQDLENIKSLQNLINKKINPEPQSSLETEVKKDYKLPVSEKKLAEITGIGYFYLKYIRHIVKPIERKTEKRIFYEYYQKHIDYINQNKEELLKIGREKHSEHCKNYTESKKK